MEPPLEILVVEDDPDLCRSACRILAQAGYATTSAGTGAEALTALRAHPPHLVLLDRQLPDIDGLEICRRIKEDPASADILVVLISGHYVQGAAQISGLETGADGYIARPIENRELLARVVAFARLARANLRLAEEIDRRRQLETGLEERVQVRTGELTSANRKLAEARRAALNLMQDATLAQQRLASANAELRGEVAERQRTEAALRRTQEQLALAQRSAGVGLWDWDIPSGRIEWSRELFGLFGLDPDRAEAGFAAWTQAIHLEDRAAAAERIETAIREGLMLDNEYRVVHPAGEVHWIQSIGSATYGADQRPLRMSGICLDVTKRREAEEALRESEALLGSTQQLSKIGGWEWDVEKQTMAWTQETYRIHDLSPAEFAPGSSEHITKSLACYDPADRSAVAEAFRRCVTTGESYDFEVPFTSVAGRSLWIRTTAKAVRQGSRTVRVVGNIMDITERRHAMERIQAALAEKEVLLKEVHHRVKNNLQVVSGLLDLQAERLTDPQVREVFKESQSRIKSIALVHETLYQSEGLARLDFRTYVQSLVAHLFRANLGRERVVRFDLRMPDVTLSLTAAVPCGLMINELVSNALKHAFREDRPTPANEVVLTWEDAGEQWRLTVADNGSGLPPDLDWHHTQTLGLRLVRLLAQQIKGVVRLAPGPGCQFVVEFAKPGGA